MDNQFAYSYEVPPEGTALAFVSEKDSVPLVLKRGSTIRFQIIRESTMDTVLCVFKGIAKATTFNNAYVKAHKGKNFIEVPEVYELLNVIVAITPTGLSDKDLLPHKTPYYERLLRYFNSYKTHPAVAKIDSALKRDQYHWLKMDAYAYVFRGDQLIKNGVYDRVSWGDTNTLDRYVPLLTDFALKANFRRFYQQNLPYYRSLIADYHTNVNIDQMKQWLEKQFPRTRYSSVKAIFSPLVAANQSANHFEDNEFREAQMHINFPFNDYFASTSNVLLQAKRQEIAFTELNHSYLNPEADQYEIRKWFGDLTKWTNKKTPEGYRNPYSCFCEYMNWALVALYHADYVKESAFDQLRESIEDRMVNRRGFSKFREFDQELLRLYRTKQPNQTVADLYPAILAWSAKQ